MVAKSRGSNMQDQEWWVHQGYDRNHPLYSNPSFEWEAFPTENPQAKAKETKARNAGAEPRITVAPTRTSNRKRPRTLAAGYSSESQTLRVVFREGAVYDYDDVTPAEWQRFKKSASPGRYISRVLGEKDYTRVE